MKNLRIPLRIVFYRDGEDWVAHCLEMGLLGDGPTKEAALDALRESVEIQVEASIEHKNLENLFSPADPIYFAMFAAGKDLKVGVLRLEIDSVSIGDTETREYSESDADCPCA
jgi:hypothetical protein